MTASPPPPNSGPCVGEGPPMPGALQEHGAVLALSGSLLVVEQASRNLGSFLPIGAEAALGRPLAELLPEAAMTAILAQRKRKSNNAVGLPGKDGRPRLFATLHETEDGLLLELEHAAPPAPSQMAEGGLTADLKLIEAFVGTLAAATTTAAVAQAATALVSEIARFDRSLIYRFNPDGSGEVIAEVRRPTAPAFLGLRFPATTVPVDVRQLAERTPLRMIADTRAAPVLVTPELNPRTGQPLDLSRTPLHSATPAQLRTWQRLGVVAAINLSLIVEDRLWGLLVCHHETPRPTDPLLRQELTGIARTAAAALARIDSSERQASEKRGTQRLGQLQQGIGQARTLLQPLLAADLGLLDLAAADGVAVIAEDTAVCVGFVPERAALRRLALLATGRDSCAASTPGPNPGSPHSAGVFIAPCLSRHDPEAALWRAQAAGMLAVVVTDDPLVVIAAFRRERRHQIIWGDRSVDQTTDQTDGESPLRQPFTARTEIVRDHCIPWEPETIAAWRALPARLSANLGGIGAAAWRLADEVATLRLLERFDDPLLRALLDTSAATLVSMRPSAEAAVECLTSNRAFRQLFPAAPDVPRGLGLEALFTAIGLDNPKARKLPLGAELDVTAPASGGGSECCGSPTGLCCAWTTVTRNMVSAPGFSKT